MKKYTRSIVLVVLAAIFLAGCDTNCSGPSSSKSKVTTINGNTQGFAEKNTENRGSAKFNVEGSHVDMTNFSFNADETGKIQATIEDEDLVFARVIVYDGDDDVWQNIIDGHYKEVFNQGNIVRQFNDLYKETTHATGSPINEEHITVQGDISYVSISVIDGYMIMIVKNDTDQFINIMYTTFDHNTEDIIERAVGALGGNVATSNNTQKSFSKTNVVNEPTPKDIEQEDEDTLTTAQTPEETNIDSDDINNYSIEIGGININIPLPSGWVTDTSDILIQCEPEKDLYVSYSDSYIKINDAERMKTEQKSVDEVWGVQSDIQEFEYAGATGYVITWKSMDVQNVCIYEPVPDGKAYLLIRINDYTGRRDLSKLVDTYSLSLE